MESDNPTCYRHAWLVCYDLAMQCLLMQAHPFDILHSHNQLKYLVMVALSLYFCLLASYFCQEYPCMHYLSVVRLTYVFLASFCHIPQLILFQSCRYHQVVKYCWTMQNAMDYILLGHWMTPTQPKCCQEKTLVSYTLTSENSEHWQHAVRHCFLHLHIII